MADETRLMNQLPMLGPLDSIGRGEKSSTGGQPIILSNLMATVATSPHRAAATTLPTSLPSPPISFPHCEQTDRSFPREV